MIQRRDLSCEQPKRPVPLRPEISEVACKELEFEGAEVG